MTDPRQAWQQPTAPPPTINKNRKTINIVIFSVIGFLVLCCGGVTVIGAFADDPKPAAKPAAAAGQTVAPRLAAPIATTTPTPPALTEATTTPSPTRTKASPSKSPKPAVTKKATPKPKPTTRKPRPRPTKTQDTVRSGAHPGAFCSPGGALGRTNTGKLMRCKTTASDDRNRWRAA